MIAVALDPLFAQIVALVMALLFASAALHKLSDYCAFQGVVRAYRLMDARAVHLAAPLVIALEVAAATLLLAGAHAMGAVLAIALLAGYAGGIALNLKRGHTQIDCGCHFGRANGRISSALVLRNLGWCALAATLLLPVAPRDWGALDTAAAIFGVAALAVLYLALEALIRNHQTWSEIVS
ncbi:MAG: MauE/DoxX family redox-associated membrane protein [Pseudomonadota bacterium]